MFNSEGWALPTRSNFRYSTKQKRILYKYFIDGEESGRKMSPEEVHLLMRNDLTPSEYVTSQQIRSLFSRWSRQKMKGTLHNPLEEDVQATNEEEDDEKNEDEEEEQFQLHLKEIASDVCSTWKINDWVAVVYDLKWYPGVLLKVSFILFLELDLLNTMIIYLFKMFESTMGIMYQSIF